MFIFVLLRLLNFNFIESGETSIDEMYV
jgi:hypothetical protein